MKNYSYLGSSKNEKFCIKGIDVFKYNWITIGAVVVVLQNSQGIFPHTRCRLPKIKK